MDRRVARGYFVSALATVLVSGCAPVEQPVSIQTITAIEVTLRTPADRSDLLAMLRRHARDGGLHVDDVSDKWAEFRKDPPPNEPAFAKSVLTKTIYVGLWRGTKDNDPEVLVDDGGHQDRPWITFLRGKHPELASRVRTGLLVEIQHRWPDAQPLPVLPSGGLPLSQDLRLTAGGYKIVRSVPQRYDLPSSSPLLAEPTVR